MCYKPWNFISLTKYRKIKRYKNVIFYVHIQIMTLTSYLQIYFLFLYHSVLFFLFHSARLLLSPILSLSYRMCLAYSYSLYFTPLPLPHSLSFLFINLKKKMHFVQFLAFFSLVVQFLFYIIFFLQIWWGLPKKIFVGGNAPLNTPLSGRESVQWIAHFAAKLSTDQIRKCSNLNQIERCSMG